MAQQLRALPPGLALNSTTHITANSHLNSSSRGSDALSGFFEHAGKIPIYTHKNKCPKREKGGKGRERCYHTPGIEGLRLLEILLFFVCQFFRGWVSVQPSLFCNLFCRPA